MVEPTQQGKTWRKGFEGGWRYDFTVAILTTTNIFTLFLSEEIVENANAS